MIGKTRFSRFHRILVTNCTNPYMNIAKELDLLYNPQSKEKILYLWRNDPVVVIGKHQNPYSECNLEYMKNNNISLVRRLTGGGAVYQDLGNTCWTFVSPKLDCSNDLQIVTDSLKSLNLNPTLSGRNDILVNNKKVSGVASRRISNNSIHHGTMLINVNLETLSKCLTVNQTKLESKGIKSVKSRVLNLKEILPDLTHEQFSESIIESFKKNILDKYGEKCEIEYTDFNQMISQASVRNRFKQLSAEHWKYYKSNSKIADLSKRFDFGLFEIVIETVEDEKVARIHSDCLSTDLVENLEEYAYEFFQAPDDKLYRNILIQSLKSKDEKLMAIEVLKWIRPLLLQIKNNH